MNGAELEGWMPIFAHNGVVTGLDVVDARLSELGADGRVKGRRTPNASLR
jgi:hypothetical protein